jgi:RecA/RadA recombinase
MAKSTNDAINAFNKFNDLLEKKVKSKVTLMGFSDIDDYIPTGNYLLNAQISGSVFGGYPNTRSIGIAGDSGAGKTFLCLNAVRELQKKDYFVFYIDTEGAIDRSDYTKFGVDLEKLKYLRMGLISDVKFFINDFIETMRENPGLKAAIFVDSVGMLDTDKSKRDMDAGKNASDMGLRSKEMRSLFKSFTLELSNLKVPFIFTNHTYACFPGDQLVITENGTTRIMDLKIGDTVDTLAGFKSIENIFIYDDAKLLELEFEDGSIIKCTPNHKFLIGEDWEDENSWIEAIDLIEGSEIICKLNLNGMKKLKVKSIKQVESSKVYDIQVKDVHHFVLENSVVAHNSMDQYTPKGMSGGGGPEFSASIILMLSKGTLRDDAKTTTGIIVRSKTRKNRLAKPIDIEFHISFHKGMNQYVGLEQFVSWENCGVGRGNKLTEKEFSKLKADEQSLCSEFEVDGEKFYFLPKKLGKNYVIRHNGDLVPVKEFFSARLFTQEVLMELDEKVIKPTFKFPETQDEIDLLETSELNDLNDDDESTF